MSTHHIRSKWAAVGAAIAVSLGAGGIGISQATTSSGEMPVYLPIEPCRLADTRPAFQVGTRNVPLGPDETYTLSGWGAVGDCTLPTGTTALSLNVTAVNTTQATFLTLFPAGGDLPVASHLNPAPGQGPVPNAVNIDLNGAGDFSIYNLAGNVDIVIDVVGIYDDHVHTGDDIVDGSLTGADIEDESVTGDDIDNGSLTGADIEDESVTGTDIDNGTVSNVDTSNEAGVARSVKSGQLAIGSDTQVTSVSIRVPSDGYVNVHVTGKWHGLAAGTDVGECDITKGTTASSGGVGIRLNDGDGDGDGSYRGFSGHATLEMDVADNPFLFTLGQVIRLVCDEVQGDVRLDQVEMTATFFPTSYAPAGLIILPLEAEGESNFVDGVEGS